MSKDAPGRADQLRTASLLSSEANFEKILYDVEEYALLFLSV
jgi:hypothetical protein